MLVLERRVNERIMIGNDIVITLCEIGRGKIRLGITAPEAVSILRAELLESRGFKPLAKAPQGVQP